MIEINQVQRSSLLFLTPSSRLSVYSYPSFFFTKEWIEQKSIIKVIANLWLLTRKLIWLERYYCQLAIDFVVIDCSTGYISYNS